MPTVYIEIEELAANALIAAEKHGRRFVSYKMMEDYGLRTTKILHDKYEIVAILLLSRNRTNEMLQSKADLFDEQEVEGEKGIVLREGKTTSDLINRYNGYLPLRFLLAFRDCRAMSVFENLNHKKHKTGKRLGSRCGVDN